MIKAMRGSLWFDTLLVLIGTFILTIAIYGFTVPNQIAPGGVSGLATAINYVSILDIGLLNLLLNLPLLVLGWLFLGKAFVFKSMVSVVSFTLFYDHIMPIFPQYVGDPLLAGIFGGVLMGVGAALTVIGEACTGGTDILAKVLQKWFPHIKLGTLLFVVDAVVIIFAAYVFNDITTALYAVITIYVATQVMNRVIYGLDLGKLVLIISQHGEAIATQLLRSTDRGVTKLYSKGAYSDEDNLTLLCAIRNNEYPHLKREVHQIDPNAFMIVTTASEVVGEGFKDIAQQ